MYLYICCKYKIIKILGCEFWIFKKKKFFLWEKKFLLNIKLLVDFLVVRELVDY